MLARRATCVNVKVKHVDNWVRALHYIIGYKIARKIRILHESHTCNYTRVIRNSIFSTLIHACYQYLPSKMRVRGHTCHRFRHLYHGDQTLPMLKYFYLTLCDNNATFKSTFLILIRTQSLSFYERRPTKSAKHPHSTTTRRLVTIAATSRGLKLHEYVYLIRYSEPCWNIPWNWSCIN